MWRTRAGKLVARAYRSPRALGDKRDPLPESYNGGGKVLQGEGLVSLTYIAAVFLSCCFSCAAQVVDPKPGFKRVVKNFQGKDYQTIGLATVLSMPFGYFAGAYASPDRLLSPI